MSDPLRVFVLSRLRGDVERNKRIAEELCLAVCRAGGAPLAPHILYTRFLDDSIPEERDMGIACGVAWLARSDLVLSWEVAGVSEGMQRELKVAMGMKKRIVRFPEEVEMREVETRMYRALRECRKA